MAPVAIEVSEPGSAEAPEQEIPARRIARLYEAHYGRIRALCQTILRDPVDADDAAQQTFLSAFSSLIEGTVPRDAGAWLTTIARRECWARAAQRRRRPLELDQTSAPASRTGEPLEEAIRNADVSAVWQAINALPRRQRAAILTREVSGLTYEEAARALGISESAVESLLVRARRQLRKRLEPVATATNVAVTPLLLLRHRLARLLSFRLSATAAVAPAVVKVGAVTAGAVVVAGSVSLGVHTLHPFQSSGPTTASASEVVRGTSSQTRLPRTAQHGPLARRLAAAERRQRDPTTQTKTSSGQGGGAPSVGTGATAGTPAQPTSSGDGADTTAQTPIDRTTAGATPPDSTPAVGAQPDTTPTATTAAEAAPTETVPTETAPTETVPTDTVPTDTAPADSPPDPVPTDPAPTSDGPGP